MNNPTLERLQRAFIAADDAGDEESARMFAAEIRKMQAAASAPAPTPEKRERGYLESLAAGIGRGVGNVGLGAQNLIGMGLEAAGAEQAGRWLQSDAAAGKAKLASEIEPYKQANPITAGVGEFVGEVVPTLPIGGALAKGVEMIPKFGKTVPALVEALRTGGLSSGKTGGLSGLSARVAGGAATGGAATGLIDPEDSTTGAAIGAALPIGGQLIKGITSAGKEIVGATTGVGGEALGQAFSTGFEGGAKGQALRGAMRGDSNMLAVLDDARANLKTLRADRRNTYLNNMEAVKQATQPIDLTPISQKLKDIRADYTFKGIPKDPQVLNALNEAEELMQNFRNLPAEQYHGAEGLDALKQQIRALINTKPFEARDIRGALGQLENAVKQQIQDRAPTYAKAMRDYSEASELIDEATRALSLGERATADTALRKLQSVMRNNANTNYGARLNVAKVLEEEGGRPIMPQLAGQALNQLMPRGIQRATVGGGGAGLAFTGNPVAAAALGVVSSPRIMGEVFHGAGRVAGGLDPVVRALRQGVYKTAPIVGTQ